MRFTVVCNRLKNLHIHAVGNLSDSRYDSGPIFSGSDAPEDEALRKYGSMIFSRRLVKHSDALENLNLENMDSTLMSEV